MPFLSPKVVNLMPSRAWVGTLHVNHGSYCKHVAQGILIHPVWLAHAYIMGLSFQWAVQDSTGNIVQAVETAPGACLMALLKDGCYMNWVRHFNDLTSVVHKMLQECGVRSSESRSHHTPVAVRIANPLEAMLHKNRCLVFVCLMGVPLLLSIAIVCVHNARL